MTATSARIAFVMEPFRRAVSETELVRTNFGSAARESDDPIETFFDTVEDAQVMADARQALLSGNRRRFTLAMKDLGEVVDLEYTAGSALLANYVDTEREADMTVIVADMTFDFAKQGATMMIWG